VGSFLATWWPVLLLIHLPNIALVVATTAYTRVKHRLDHAVPDTLPQTAGQWLDAELAAIGLASRVTAIPADKSLNAYFIAAHTIVLDKQTYFKRDPVYWAIAAHELGHAQFKVTRPKLAVAFELGDRIKGALTTLGLGLALGNMLFALPGVTTAAFVCLTVALVFCGLDLADEIVASRFAMRALRKSAALTPTHLVSARTTLMFALLTYMTAFAALAVLLTQWHVVVHMTSPHVGTSTLTAFGHGALVVASAIGFAFPFAMLGSKRLRGLLGFISMVTVLSWIVAFPTLVWLMWDLRGGTTYAWCVLLAFLPLAPAVVALVKLPLAVVVRYFRHLGSMLEGPGIESSDVYRADLQAGTLAMHAGNAAYERMRKTLGARPIRALTLLYVLLYLPLLCAYWFM
jgi:Zn-dependent membrane protease YugP